MVPFDTTRVIPTGWSAHHQPVVVTSMNATCRVVDPARSTGGGVDEETGTALPGAPFVVAEGIPCRIQQLSSSDPALLLGGIKDQQRAYRVAVPAGTPQVHVDYLLDRFDAPNDPTLAGVALHVDQVLRGSELFDRYLICTESQD